MTASERLAIYRRAMLERKAVAAGCTVQELLERGEREYRRQLEIHRLAGDRDRCLTALERHIGDRWRWCPGSR